MTWLGPRLGLHQTFVLLFVPTTFVIAASGAVGVGLGLRRRELARKLWWRVGLAAGLLFLIVSLAMLALGWRIGAPGAPGAQDRFTMLTVLFVSEVGAAFAAGAVLARALGRSRAG